VVTSESKKNRCVGVFQSIHCVMKLESLLEEEKIWCDIVPVPREISSDCTMGLVFNCSDLEKIREKALSSGGPPRGVFRLSDGKFESLDVP
jgi:hypothetical protein